jgi:hypothetical protein
MGERRDKYVIFIMRSEGIRALEVHMCLYGNDIKMDFVEIVLGNVDRITFIQNSDQWLVFVNKVMSLSVP